MDHLRVASPATCEARATKLGSRGVAAHQPVTLAGTVATNRTGGGKYEPDDIRFQTL